MFTVGIYFGCRDSHRHGDLCRSFRQRTYSATEKITVGPLQSKIVTLRVSVGEEEYAELCEVFENGFYLEGYVYLEAADENAVDLSIPFMGFSGDWDALPIFDDSYAPTYLTSAIKIESSYIMVKVGENIFLTDERSIEAGENEKITAGISPDNDSYGDVLGISFANIRNIASSYVEVIDDKGNVVMKSGELDVMTKAHIGVDAIDYNGISYVWDGRDTHNSLYVMPEGNYTMVFYADNNS